MTATLKHSRLYTAPKFEPERSAGHDLHAATPIARSLYLPLVKKEHEIALVLPVPQMRQAATPAVLYLPAAQSMQAVTLAAPAAPYRPAPQPMQTAADVCLVPDVLYLSPGLSMQKWLVLSGGAVRALCTDAVRALLAS